MAQMDLLLPEIMKGDFYVHGHVLNWLLLPRNGIQQKTTILPTLLCGKLVDIFIELDEETRVVCQC